MVLISGSFAGLCIIMGLIGFANIRFASPAGVAGYWFLGWLAQAFAPQLALTMALLLGVALSSNTSHVFVITLAAIALVILLALHWRGHRSSIRLTHYIETAVARMGAVPTIGGGSRYLLSGLLPFQFGAKNVKRQKNVRYGPADNANLLDIYSPLAPALQPRPILIQVPGGAWVTGSKDQQALRLMNTMASQGWVCFAINYRLGPKARFPAMLEDVLLAINWVKQHAHEYGGDPDYVVLTGGSAGGHLVSLAALLQDRAQFQPGFETADTRVSLVVPIYGRYDFMNRYGLLPGTGLEPFLTQKVMPDSPQQCPELWQQASPVAQVHAAAPQFLVVHGTKDSMIPVEEACEFVAALRKVSQQPVDFVELIGAEHAFDLVSSSWTVRTVDALAQYLNAHHQAHNRDIKTNAEV